MPRPSKWLDTEPPVVNWAWPVLITDSSILCFSVSLPSSPIMRRVDGALADVLLRVGVEHEVLVLQQGLRRGAAPPLPAAASTAAGGAGCAAASGGATGWAGAASAPWS